MLNSGNIFVEQIPLRLSNMEDIPYPDSLHLYDATIHGFEQLAAVAMPFRIDEDQIGVNGKGQVKVWCNTAFENSQILGQMCPEAVMVTDLVEVLLSNVDQSSAPPGLPSIHSHLNNPTPVTSFRQLEDRFVDYVRRFCHGEIPTALGCIF